MRPITEIIIHCTATRPEWWQGKTTAQKVAEVRRWHVEDNGWKDVGYHFLIDRDGKLAKGRPLEQTGAHTRGKNTGTIGIALFGGHGGATTDVFADHFTPEQDTALRNLLADLQTKFPKIAKVSGHHEYAAKACPCFSVAEWLKSGPQRFAKPQPPQKTDPAPVAPSLSLWGLILRLLKGAK